MTASPESLPVELLGFSSVLALGLFLLWLALKRTVEKAVDKKFREWEVQFTKFHERRVEVVEAIQDQLVHVRGALDLVFEYMGGNPDPEDPDALGKQLLKALDHHDEVCRILDTRRFYLPKELVGRIEVLLKQMTLANALAGIDDTRRGGQVALGESPEQIAQAERWLKEIRVELPALIEEIDDEFRRIVGG